MHSRESPRSCAAKISRTTRRGRFCCSKPTPGYLHAALVLGPNGEKLSKQNGAQPLDASQPLLALNAAAQVLGLSVQRATIPQALASWQAQWRDSYNLPGD